MEVVQQNRRRLKTIAVICMLMSSFSCMSNSNTSTSNLDILATMFGLCPNMSQVNHICFKELRYESELAAPVFYFEFDLINTNIDPRNEQAIEARSLATSRMLLTSINPEANMIRPPHIRKHEFYSKMVTPFELNNAIVTLSSIVNEKRYVSFAMLEEGGKSILSYVAVKDEVDFPTLIKNVCAVHNKCKLSIKE